MALKKTHPKNPRQKYLFIGIGFILGLIVLSKSVKILNSTHPAMPSDSCAKAGSHYDPTVNPDDFTHEITNTYFTLPEGKEMVYEKDTREGKERVKISISGKTKKVMGVKTLVYKDKVWLDSNRDGTWDDDEMVEDTRDYLAQHKNGDVWYFGEDVNNYENGKLKDHGGAWLAGKDGAKPGIWVKADPKVGECYRQEYYPSKAEDMVEVLSVNETVTTQLGTFTNCLKTYDFTPLEQDSKEHKYYCPEVGSVVRAQHLVDKETANLIEVQLEESDD